jgi:Fe2+ transport system protein FeoA
MMRCPLCGYKFDESVKHCHTACAMNHNCALVCCPHCGYQMVDETQTKAASWMRKLFSRQTQTSAPTPNGLKRLSDLAPGQSGEVVTIATRQAARLDRLSALGVVPGSLVTLRQRAPAFVLRVGETELTVDESIAQEILTRA